VSSRAGQPPLRRVAGIESSAIDRSTAQRLSDYFKLKKAKRASPTSPRVGTLKNEAAIRGGLKFQTGCEVRDNSEPRQPEWSKDGTLEPLGIHKIYQNRRHRF
jgi:hypothetical protein